MLGGGIWVGLFYLIASVSRVSGDLYFFHGYLLLSCLVREINHLYEDDKDE